MEWWVGGSGPRLAPCAAACTPHPPPPPPTQPTVYGREQRLKVSRDEEAAAEVDAAAAARHAAAEHEAKHRLLRERAAARYGYQVWVGREG